MKFIFYSRKSPEVLHRYLTDMQLLSTVHPVIERIDPTGPFEYKVREKISFKIGSIRFHYTVKVFVLHRLNKIIYSTCIMNMVKISMAFSIHPQPGKVMIEEDIFIDSRLPLKKLLYVFLKKQHTQLFQNIETDGRFIFGSEKNLGLPYQMASVLVNQLTG